MLIETVLDFPFEMVPFFSSELLNFGGIAPMILFPSTKSLAKDRCCSCDRKITTAWPAVAGNVEVFLDMKISTHLFDIKISRFILEFRKKNTKNKTSGQNIVFHQPGFP